VQTGERGRGRGVCRAEFESPRCYRPPSTLARSLARSHVVATRGQRPPPRWRSASRRSKQTPAPGAWPDYCGRADKPTATTSPSRWSMTSSSSFRRRTTSPEDAAQPPKILTPRAQPQNRGRILNESSGKFRILFIDRRLDLAFIFRSKKLKDRIHACVCDSTVRRVQIFGEAQREISRVLERSDGWSIINPFFVRRRRPQLGQ